MTSRMKIAFAAIEILVIFACLIPWSVSGDFISIWVPGIQFTPSIKDNGGVIVLLLSLISLLFTLKPLTLIKQPYILAIVANTAQVAFLTNRISGVIKAHLEAEDLVGAPSVAIGLFMAALCSITALILLVSLEFKTLKEATDRTR